MIALLLVPVKLVVLVVLLAAMGFTTLSGVSLAVRVCRMLLPKLQKMEMNNTRLIYRATNTIAACDLDKALFQNEQIETSCYLFSVAGLMLFGPAMLLFTVYGVLGAFLYAVVHEGGDELATGVSSTR